jgi:hypothetical protein
MQQKEQDLKYILQVYSAEDAILPLLLSEEVDDG